MTTLDNGEKVSVNQVKAKYYQLHSELEETRSKIAAQDIKIQELTSENADQKKEIDDLKCLINDMKRDASRQLAVIPEDPKNASKSYSRADSLDKFIEIVNKVRRKRLAISAESAEHTSIHAKESVPKDESARKLIERGFQNNNFLRHLDKTQVDEIISYMYLKVFKKEEYVIRQDDFGDALFVISSGKVRVTVGDDILGKPLGTGVLFGELAILYNCKRTASVQAIQDVHVWTLERGVYQNVMRQSATVKREAHHQFLRDVPLFKGLHLDILFKIVDVATEESFQADQYIIREGELGDSFFVIIQGGVRVMKIKREGENAEEIRKLSRGDYFGEKALLSEDVRTASIVAEKAGAKCLVIERDIFKRYIGCITQIAESNYGDKEQMISEEGKSGKDQKEESSPVVNNKSKFEKVTLKQFKVISTLGTGGFGRVELVEDKDDKTKTYALKCLSKQHIVQTKQQEHILNEKNILQSLNSKFIINLYKTFKDRKYVYLLLEVCLGGEIFTILRQKDVFDEDTTRFCIACVVEAFAYLHRKGIAYRDLKPENLLMDNDGYVKLVDLGFAKKLQPGKKTWTFCGTPEYVAPEIILNKGHDCSVDYWALGILVFELLTGNPPFFSNNVVNTYGYILKGIDSVDFPSNVKLSAKHVIKNLCKFTPSERLGNQKDGASDIRKHKWFQGFHWNGLINRTLRPPIVPQIKGPSDTSNFDFFPPNEGPKPRDEMSGWDKDF